MAQEQPDDYHLLLVRSKLSASQTGMSTEQETVPAVAVLVSSQHFGQGDAELGAVLMRAFIKTLREVRPAPSAILFVNTGVNLTTKGSELIDDLRALEELGAKVLSCGTCLDFYGLKEKLQVGSVTNMYNIVATLVSTDRVVRP